MSNFSKINREISLDGWGPTPINSTSNVLPSKLDKKKIGGNSINTFVCLRPHVDPNFVLKSKNFRPFQYLYSESKEVNISIIINFLHYNIMITFIKTQSVCVLCEFCERNGGFIPIFIFNKRK